MLIAKKLVKIKIEKKKKEPFALLISYEVKRLICVSFSPCISLIRNNYRLGGFLLSG